MHGIAKQWHLRPRLYIMNLSNVNIDSLNTFLLTIMIDYKGFDILMFGSSNAIYKLLIYYLLNVDDIYRFHCFRRLRKSHYLCYG